MVAKSDTLSAEVAQLVVTLKRELKAHGLTYRDLAQSLRVSEASIKRVFANRSFTLARLADICGFLGFTMAELLQLASTSAPALDTLTVEQEAELISDDKLVLVAVCALNHWSLSDIVDFYHLTRGETVKRLRILDRMGLIELLPGDRIRRRAKRDFAWIKHGPIHRFFVGQGLRDFLHAPFDADHESLEFANGMLTAAAQAELKLELRRLRAKIASLHDQSISSPLVDKSGVGVLLALRRWEPTAFARLRRAAPNAATVSRPNSQGPTGSS